MTVEMETKLKHLSEAEIKELHELLQSEPLLEKMVERAVRGMRRSGSRPRRTPKSA